MIRTLGYLPLDIGLLAEKFFEKTRNSFAGGQSTFVDGQSTFIGHKSTFGGGQSTFIGDQSTFIFQKVLSLSVKVASSAVKVPSVAAKVPSSVSNKGTLPIKVPSLIAKVPLSCFATTNQTVFNRFSVFIHHLNPIFMAPGTSQCSLSYHYFELDQVEPYAQ